MSEEYPEKLAEHIDKLDFNNLDFAEEMIDIWNLAQRELISEFVESFNEMWHKIATVMSNWSVGSEYSFKAEQHVEINDILDVFKREWEKKAK